MGQMRRKLIAVATAIMVVAGCGASGGDETAEPTAAEPTASTESTVTTEATTTTTEAIDYGDQYLDLVAESNCAQQQVIAAEDALEDADGQLYEEVWPAYRDTVLPLAQEWADSLVRFYEGLLAASWPEEVQEDIESLAAQVSTAAGNIQALAEVESWAALVDRYENSPTDTQENIAGVIRAKLGLESNVGNETLCSGP